MSHAQNSSGLLRRRIARSGIALALPLVIGAVTSCSTASETSSAPATSPSEATSSAPTESGGSAPAEGSDSESSTMLLEVTEDDFTIELPQDELEAGSFTVEVVNEGGAVHDLVVEDASGTEVAATEVISPGGTATLELELAAGDYVFYCSVANHRGMGMELAVTVV